MKKPRIGLLTVLVIITILGSFFAIGRIRAQAAAPDPGSVKFDICSGTVQAPQEEDQPCAVGNAPDEQAYGFGIDCALTNPATTAAPCQGLFGPTVTGHTAQSLTITIVFSNPDPSSAPFVLAAEVGSLPTGLLIVDGAWHCFGVANFATGSNDVCPPAAAGAVFPDAFAIQPGHCSTPLVPSTCVAPSSGAITLTTTDPFIGASLSNGGPNVLVLDFLSGNNIQIDNIQAVIAFS